MDIETKVSTGLQLFKERLKDLRGKKTLQEVAQDLGVSRATLGYYENGDRKPDIEILIKIAAYYNVSTDYLLGLTDFTSVKIEDRIISEQTGLSEDALKELYKINNSTFLDCRLKKLTLTYLLSDITDMLNLITMYLFTDFDSACEIQIDEANSKISYHLLETEGKIPETQIPLTQLGFLDKRLKTIRVNRNKDFFLNAYILEIQKELISLREKIKNIPI